MGRGADTFLNQYSNTPNKIKYLHRAIFKNHAQIVHNRLMQTFLEEKELDSLKGKTVEFDDTKPEIIVNGKTCSLPPAKNEDYLAKAMFSREIGEFVDWSIIYKEMTGSNAVIGQLKDQKTVRDAVNRLNKRIKGIFGVGDKLLDWENKSIRRNF